MRFRFIHEHAKQFSVRVMCRVLGVSASGYYAWCSRPESMRSREDRRLRTKIRVAFKRSRATYSATRIQRDLQDDGESCGRHRIARLMREDGLTPKKARQFRVTTQRRHSDAVAANLLNQDFAVEKPDTVWAGDITYLRTGDGWLYLAVLLDLCTRSIVGWSLSRYIDEELALAALRRAVDRRSGKPGLILHSDRGSQYTSADYDKELKKHGFRASMSRKGNCWDNAPVESFFDSLKTEIDPEALATHDDARRAVFDYIEVFYNRQRRHSALDHVSPADFERRLDEVA